MKKNIYHFEFYTQNGLFFAEYDNINNLYLNVKNKIYYYKDCNLKVINLSSKKEYELISMNDILSLCSKDINLDSAILTTFSIKEETLDSTQVPIEIIYPIISRLKLHLNIKIREEVINPLKKELENQPQTLSLESNKPIIKRKDLPILYQKKLSLIGFSENDEILQTFDELNNQNETIFLLTQSFEKNRKLYEN